MGTIGREGNKNATEAAGNCHDFSTDSPLKHRPQQGPAQIRREVVAIVPGTTGETGGTSGTSENPQIAFAIGPCFPCFPFRTSAAT